MMCGLASELVSPLLHVAWCPRGYASALDPTCMTLITRVSELTSLTDSGL